MSDTKFTPPPSPEASPEWLALLNAASKKMHEDSAAVPPQEWVTFAADIAKLHDDAYAVFEKHQLHQNGGKKGKGAEHPFMLFAQLKGKCVRYIQAAFPDDHQNYIEWHALLCGTPRFEWGPKMGFPGGYSVAAFFRKIIAGDMSPAFGKEAENPEHPKMGAPVSQPPAASP